jgi:ABC-type nitrate/sulfonate/bicarbonate transport system permease component
LINHYSDYFLTADMYVPILFIMAIAIVIQGVANTLQRRLTPWSNASRRDSSDGGA